MALRAIALLPLAASLVSPVMAEPRVAAMTIHRREDRGLPLRKRSGPETVTVNNDVPVGLYYVNATVGTPGQAISLQIDTGSSDVWMFGVAACNSAGCSGGDFNPSQSTTFQQLGQSGLFQIEYVTPGSGVSGNYFNDDFTIGDIKLSNLTMAVATTAKAVTSGIMGIGFTDDESIYANSNGQVTYPSIIDVMVSENVIASHSYSLWLNDLGSSTGTVLFGGYDTDKYHEPLTVLEIQPDSQTGIIDAFTVAWSLIAVTDSAGTTLLNVGDFPLPAVLDSGTTLTVVPQDIFDQLAGYFNATSLGENQGYGVPCSNADWSGAIDYGFGGSSGAIIQVPFSELAVPAYNTDGSKATFSDGTPLCQFGFEPVGQDSPVLLGDTFLRSAYVIYDLEAEQVAIAQTNFNSGSSNVQEIPAGKNLVSILGSAATAATSITVSQTATAKPGGSNGTIATPIPSGAISSVTGVKTTLSLATPVTAAPTGSSGSGGSGSGSSTSKGAAAGVFVPLSGEVSMALGTLFTLFAGGAAFMAFL